MAEMTDFDPVSYLDAYRQFLDTDLAGFVAAFACATGGISAERAYYFAGNGASAAIASHLANDFSKALQRRARTFHDPALMTCFGNDYGYENWIGEAVRLYAQKDDVLVLISSSGRSANIIEAARVAQEKGLVTISLTGPQPSAELVAMSACHLAVNSQIYNIIECCHMLALCAVVDSVNMVTL